MATHKFNVNDPPVEISIAHARGRRSFIVRCLHEPGASRVHSLHLHLRDIFISARTINVNKEKVIERRQYIPLRK